MGRFSFVLAVALAACSSAPKGGGDGGGGSGGAVDMTAGPPDLTPRPIAGIACGANTCTTTLELCCTGDNGATGTCQKAQNPMCGLSEFECDGPEDCEPANPECCVQGGFAACRPSGYCSSKGGTFMCHTTADCTPFVAGAICHAANNSPYAICF